MQSRLTPVERDTIRKDYEQWTGGFAPEDADQIQDYVSLTLPEGFDDGDVLDWLLTQIGGWTDNDTCCCESKPE